MMATLDGSIANTALPTIARELNVTASASVWVVNGFQLAAVASLFTFAALGATRGPARIYRLGVAAFIAGSLACALVRSLPLLVIMRALQGIGAAAIMSLSPLLLRDIFPRAQLGRALGVSSVVTAMSAAAGPTVGGAILAVAPWPWLFGINVPLGLATIVLGRAIPNEARAHGRIDLVSMVTSAVAFGALVYGLDGFARHEALPLIVFEVALGIASGIVCVARQRRLEHPMISVDLFTNRTFSLAAATSCATFLAQGVAFVTLPFYFQSEMGFSPVHSGLLLTSWPLAVAVAAPFAGRLSDRYPAAVLTTAGLAVLTAGLALYAIMPVSASPLQIVLHGVVCGLGFGFFQSPNNRELLGSAPREKASTASAVLATVRVSGQTLGASFVAIVFAAFGAAASETNGLSAHIAAAVPVALWGSCAAAAVATFASALRYRSGDARAAFRPSA